MMCNIHFDEQAVRRALAERAQYDKVPLPVVSVHQIFRDVYDGQPVGGIRLHFIQKVKRAMTEEAIRNAFVERAKKEHRNVNQIYFGNAARDVFGMPENDRHFPSMEWHDEYARTVGIAQDVQYDMMIEESHAKSAP